jgi:hypothetical protein
MKNLSLIMVQSYVERRLWKDKFWKAFIEVYRAMHSTRVSCEAVYCALGQSDARQLLMLLRQAVVCSQLKP